MSGCLCFRKKLEGIKEHLQVHIVSCKTFSQEKTNIFQRKHKLTANTLSF